ncbi:MAG TPA: protoheme IX farnesyltransferase, partial [Pseudomonas sp.]|nr:protoheme IX farnesyltransferase [Pseudomonas sp.]
KRGIDATKLQIVLYILAFTGASLLLTLTGFAGYGYLLIALLVSAWWLVIALSGYRAVDDRLWARKLFAFSIVTISALSLMMSIDFQAITHTSLLTML